MTSNKQFYHLLLRKTIAPTLSILGVGLLYVWLMTSIDHQAFQFSFIVILLATTKTLLIAFSTLKHLTKVAETHDSFEELLLTFGLLIGLTIFSFASGFACLYEYDPTSFSGVHEAATNYPLRLFQFFYFSIVTFSTVGYGDIVPESTIAQYLIILEVFLSFLIIVFAFANIKKH